jgi:predicted nucleotidyltransferase
MQRDKTSIIKRLQAKDIVDYLQQHNIAHIRLAWSFAHDTTHQDSDIDIVYQERDNNTIDEGILGVPRYFEQHIFGRHIDFIDIQRMNHHIAPFIKQTMKSIW